MKISLQWLAEYTKTTLSATEISDILTDIGLEVEGTHTYQRIKGGLQGLVVGLVTSKIKHPNPQNNPKVEKISLTTVNVGGAQDLHIVCGAPNVAVGQKVVVATDGAILYPLEGESFTIKKSKVYGEPSEGMICGKDEIGFPPDGSNGIWVLDENATIGQPLGQYLNLESDTVLDINLTPNRSDATGHLGVAFDLAAALQINHNQAFGGFAKPNVSKFNVQHKNLAIEVAVENTTACPRYSGVCIQGVKVAASPEWLQHRLQAIGLTPINNVVDITNFVLHELGQPLHAFDYEAIAGKKVIVKNLAKDTKFVTLDKVERKLHEEDLMICDGNGNPMCIGGVFGGLESGVKETTTNIFLESAHFQPVSIRRSSMRHLLRTDAATRFEKGTDPNGTVYALQRAALLIQELAGGTIASEIVDIYPQKTERAQVQVWYRNVERLLGVAIPKETVFDIFKALDINVLHESAEGVLVNVPTNKVDVTREADVLEELLRIYGFNRVEVPTSMKSVLAFENKPNALRVKNIVSDLLSNRGFNEMMATSMTKSDYVKNLLPELESNWVLVNNTSNQHLDLMRPTMLFSGLETILHNQNRQNHDLKLYEFGKTYHQETGKEQTTQYTEKQHLVIYLTGQHLPNNWLHKNPHLVNFYTLKAQVETVLQRLGLSGFQQTALAQGGDTTFAYGLTYHRGKQQFVTFGRVQPSLTKAFDLKQPVFYADFNWDNILQSLQKQKIQYQAVPKYPAVRRDLAMVVDKNITFAQIVEIANKQGKKLLKETNLFDVFEDETKVGKDKKSYAVSFVFQDEEKTLRDQDIDGVLNSLMQAYEKQLAATIRK